MESIIDKMKEKVLPRRNCLDRCVVAELAIYNAMIEIEKVGADIKLTDAITKLNEAKDLVSDFVDDENIKSLKE